ncbi:amidase [Vineibacter terrae]|uniref:Indoleacetamide hydrolase n=1 Tax=Vineibacter terrae TaxID=2586908 RepID=A0A5C8PPA5_9HYPH|nr:amidase [Vineibacter terrae]TXL75702.1 amidase [Vineibacter terrae]
MSLKDIHYLDLVEVARRIRAGALSPVALTQAMLERIEKTQGTLKSYATVTADLAMQQARQAEAEIGRGAWRGPLHGVPIAVKDLCYTKGIPTAAGMPIHASFRPDHDATVVQRFADAGAVLLGKLQLTEGAFADHHPSIAPPVNPWHQDHWSGASSSGSGVATAAGLCFASLGSDTGGSIRFPSAANGVTGLKPTWGRVSRYGVFALAESLDHIGPMTRSAADAAAVLGVIAGADANDPTARQEPVPNYLAGLERPIRGVRIGVDRSLNTTGVDKTMIGVVDDALAVLSGLGAEIRDVTFPSPDEAVKVWLPLCAVETAVAHEATFPKQADQYGPGVRGLIELGRGLSGFDLTKIQLVREAFRGRVAAFFQDVDLLLIPAQYTASPTTATMATLGQDENALSMLLRFTAPFDMTGSPTITLPGGFTDKGLPVAFQLVSRHMEEDLLLRAGHAFQLATDWHKRRPPV